MSNKMTKKQLAKEKRVARIEVAETSPLTGIAIKIAKKK
jgi:hypothetical protein